MKYDLMIPLAPKDVEIFPYCADSLHYLNPQPERIFIVTPSPDLARQCLDSIGLEAEICEDKDMFPFAGEGKKPSWYQQVVKLFQTVTSNNYFVMDSDMVLLDEFRVVSPRGKILFTKFGLAGPNEGYWGFMEEAFGQEKVRDFSLVCHHMLFRRDICRAMLADFVVRHPNPDSRPDEQWFYDWMMIKGKSYESLISEYEAYGSYALDNYADEHSVILRSIYEHTVLHWDRSVQLIEEHLKKAKDTRCSIFVMHRRDGSIPREWKGEG